MQVGREERRGRGSPRFSLPFQRGRKIFPFLFQFHCSPPLLGLNGCIVRRKNLAVPKNMFFLEILLHASSIFSVVWFLFLLFWTSRGFSDDLFWEFLCNLSLSLSYSPPAGGGAAPPWREIAFLSNFPFTLIFKKKSLKSEYRNNTEPSPHLTQKSLSFSGGNSRPTFRRSATPDPTPDNNGCLSHSPSPPPISNGPGVKKTKGFG